MNDALRNIREALELYPEPVADDAAHHPNAQIVEIAV